MIRVDWRAGLSLVGRVVKWIGVTIGFPLAVAVFYQEWNAAIIFGSTIVVAVLIGTALERLREDPKLGVREAFLVVTLTWLVAGLIGAIPYVLAGHGTVASPVNAVFESMSGFTTTGATVMSDISTTTHSRSLLLWRQQTQWLGGMGIVVLAIAILPELSVGGAQLMEAEAPGPGIEKLTPRIAETARALWTAYLGITLIEIIALFGLHIAGLAPNMTFYNAVAHGFTTMSTGGFSPEARSIEAFSAIVQWVIIPFMIIAGTNFALFWHVLNGNPRQLWRDAEFKFYLGVLATVTAVVTGLLFTGTILSDSSISSISSVEGAIRSAAFQVTAIVTTTGYASVDFNMWTPLGQYILLFCMFIGGSAGSTGGSIKVIRWLVILKSFRRELFTSVHPDAVRPIRIGTMTVDERAVRGIYAFTLLYIVVFFVSTGLVFLDTARVGLSLSVIESMSAVAATLGNIGPGFGILGPMNNYLQFPISTKLYMIGLMWVGRLEVLPVFVLLTSTYWRS